MYNFLVANSERLTILPFKIKGPLSAVEAQEVLFEQATRGTNIMCVFKDPNGELVIKTGNPSKLIKSDDIGQLSDLYSAMQNSLKIIINY